jgi:hypothetical protein
VEEDRHCSARAWAEEVEEELLLLLVLLASLDVVDGGVVGREGKRKKKGGYRSGLLDGSHTMISRASYQNSFFFHPSHFSRSM